MSEQDHAAAYVELSRVNQEQLWRRRGVQWKINFLLWGSIAAVVGFLYTQEDIHLGGLLFGVIVGVFFLTLVTYCAHLVNCLLADEIDIAWMHYFKKQAELSLGLNLNDCAPQSRPDTLTKMRVAKDRKIWRKYLWHLAMMGITLLLTLAGILLVWEKI